MILPADRGSYGCGGSDTTVGFPQEVLEQVSGLHGHPTNLGYIPVFRTSRGSAGQFDMEESESGVWEEAVGVGGGIGEVWYNKKIKGKCNTSNYIKTRA